MQIIRYSKEAKWITECVNCGCVFVYRGDEVQRQPYQEYYKLKTGSLPKAAEAIENELHEVSHVECPECHYKVRVPNMAMYRKPIAADDGLEDWD